MCVCVCVCVCVRFRLCVCTLVASKAACVTLRVRSNKQAPLRCRHAASRVKHATAFQTVYQSKVTGAGSWRRRLVPRLRHVSRMRTTRDGATARLHIIGHVCFSYDALIFLLSHFKHEFPRSQMTLVSRLTSRDAVLSNQPLSGLLPYFASL